MTTKTQVAVALIVALAGGADAAIIQSTPAGFVVRHEANVDAPPAKVYDALIQVGSWWSPDHTYSGDAKNMSIDARAGGCFCEKLADGGSVEHLRVVYVAPGRALRLAGALGPLQAGGVAGSMTWRLTKAEPGTKLELSYTVGGLLEGGLDKMAGPVDSVLAEQFQRLKRFVETGKAAAN